jgi:hypothetical protein
MAKMITISLEKATHPTVVLSGDSPTDPFTPVELTRVHRAIRLAYSAYRGKFRLKNAKKVDSITTAPVTGAPVQKETSNAQGK